MYGGQSTHIPIRIVQGGVLPIILLFYSPFPCHFSSIFQGSKVMASIASALSPNSPLYLSLYAALIIFFTYFYTAVSFNPVELAENMQKYGGFIRE